PDIRPIAPSTVEGWWETRPIACAVAPTGELHVCVIANAGDLYHAVRDTTGSWQPFQKVDKAAIGTKIQLGLVAMAIDPDGDTHVAVITRDSAGLSRGQLWYAKNWTGFERLEPSKSEFCAVTVGYTT